MQQNIENQIRERAYQFWLANGCPDGESNRHWLAAEREVLSMFATLTPAVKPHGATSTGAKAPPKARRRAA